MGEKIRICKFLSMCGVASRRGADKLVEQGKIHINHRRAVLGDMVERGRDKVTVDGKPVGAETEPMVYIMLNKPRGYITSRSDDRGRKTVLDLLGGVTVRVSPVGRLDYHSEGLLLLSSDGDFIYQLTHPKHDITKKYEVLIRGQANPKQLDMLNKGMTIDGYRLKPAKVIRKRMNGENEVLEFTITEGRNRQVRKMCEFVGLFVKRLKRTSIGLLELEDLKPGHWRYLNPVELELVLGKEKTDG